MHIYWRRHPTTGGLPTHIKVQVDNLIRECHPKRYNVEISTTNDHVHSWSGFMHILLHIFNPNKNTIKRYAKLIVLERFF